MQDQTIFPTKLIKITLPVGAILGGLRHLGGGEFVGDFAPHEKCLLMGGRIPLVIEGVVDEKTSDGWNSNLASEFVDDPLRGVKKCVVVSLVQLPESSTIPGLLGLSQDEYQRRYDVHEKYSKSVFEATLAAYREANGLSNDGEEGGAA